MANESGRDRSIKYRVNCDDFAVNADNYYLFADIFNGIPNLSLFWGVIFLFLIR
jgi:hypothetical protein